MKDLKIFFKVLFVCLQNELRKHLLLFVKFWNRNKMKPLEIVFDGTVNKTIMGQLGHPLLCIFSNILFQVYQMCFGLYVCEIVFVFNITYSTIYSSRLRDKDGFILTFLFFFICIIRPIYNFLECCPVIKSSSVEFFVSIELWYQGIHIILFSHRFVKERYTDVIPQEAFSLFYLEIEQIISPTSITYFKLGVFNPLLFQVWWKFARHALVLHYNSLRRW